MTETVPGGLGEVQEQVGLPVLRRPSVLLRVEPLVLLRAVRLLSVLLVLLQPVVPPPLVQQPFVSPLKTAKN